MARKRRDYDNLEARIQDQRERGAEILGRHQAGIKDNFSMAPIWVVIPVVILIVVLASCGAVFFLLRMLAG
jgi:hypothetical protein